MIYVTGDTHGDWITRLKTDSFPEQKEMTKDDYVIILGDFGLWNCSKSEEYRLDWLEEKPFTTLFISGNHDNYDILDDLPTQQWNGGSFRTEPTKEVIDEFAEYNGLNVGDTKVARQYFNKYCSECTTGKDKDGNPKPTRIKNKEVIAMNLKFHGREIDKFLCKKCFKKLYEMDDSAWDRYVASFKRSHCALFDTYED